MVGVETVYRVSGMSCAQCAQKVTSAISGLSGVTQVDVDVDRGRVVVHGTETVSREDVRTAVERAGYRLLGA